MNTYNGDDYSQSTKEHVESMYDTIMRRKKKEKLIKSLSTIAFIVAMLLLLLTPIFTVGKESFTYLDVMLNDKKETTIAGQINSVLGAVESGNLSFIAIIAGGLYVIVRAIALAFSLLLFVLKCVFGGFVKFFVKDVSYEEKVKVVNKYNKKNSHQIKKGILRYIFKLIIVTLFPPIATFFDIKGQITSFILPLLFAIMFITGIYMPLNTISGTIIADLPLTINMHFVLAATVFGVAHTALIAILIITEKLHKWNKVK